MSVDSKAGVLVKIESRVGARRMLAPDTSWQEWQVTSRSLNATRVDISRLSKPSQWGT